MSSKIKILVFIAAYMTSILSCCVVSYSYGVTSTLKAVVDELDKSLDKLEQSSVVYPEFTTEDWKHWSD